VATDFARKRNFDRKLHRKLTAMFLNRFVLLSSICDSCEDEDGIGRQVGVEIASRSYAHAEEERIVSFIGSMKLS
jgi:hypothetical protein